MRFPKDLDKFFMDYLDNMLPGRDTLYPVQANCLFLDTIEEILYYFIIDIGLQKGQLYLSETFPDLFLPQNSFSSKPFKYPLEPA